jgi:deoxyribonuclease V
VNIADLHRWDVRPADAIRIQNDLRARVAETPFRGPLQTVAGVDVGVHDDMARAAVVVLRYPELTLLESVIVDMPASFPYVPGLLAFREAPAVLSAFEKLAREPDLIIVDGQGLAHPRRFGIACHLGVVLDRPTIGCAKSRLVGTHHEPGAAVGSWVELRDTDEVIGAVLRSREGASPLYISIGHKVDLETAVRSVLACCRGYRLPETTRQAHLAASQRTGAPAVVQRSLF